MAVNVTEGIGFVFNVNTAVANGIVQPSSTITTYVFVVATTGALPIAVFEFAFPPVGFQE